MRKTNHKPGVDKLDTPEGAEGAANSIKLAEALGFVVPPREPEPVEPVKPVEMSKELSLHGVDCRMERAMNDGSVVYRAMVLQPEIAGEGSGFHHQSEQRYSFWGSPDDERGVHDRAMRWLDATALSAYIGHDSARGILAPDHVIDGVIEDGLRKVVGNLVRTVWERPHDDNGERGLIDHLEIDEQDISVQLDGGIDSDFPMLGYVFDFFRDDSQNTSELEVKAELIRLLGPADTGDKWVAFFQLSEV